DELPPPAKRYCLQTASRMWRDFCEQALPRAESPPKSRQPPIQVFVAAGQSPGCLARTLESLNHQTYQNFSVAVVTDSSAQLPDFDYAIFIGPGCYPRPDLIAMLVAALENSGVEAVTSFVEIRSAETCQ